MQSEQTSNTSRRSFIKTSAAVSSAAMFASLGTNFAHAQGSDRIRVGVIGAGGRGSGAVGDVQNAGKAAKVEVTIEAIADAFPDPVKQRAEQWGVKADKTYVGLDAYQKLLADSDLNYVILSTPPGFRPIHFEAAVNAGKNIFCEKPVAVDPVGIRKFIAAAELAEKKKLGVVAGTQRRHDPGYIEAVKRIHDGAIGDINHMSVYWNQGSLWVKPRKPEWSDLEWQLRNWYYFVYFCGDHIVEQHIHNLDVANWVMGSHPISAYGMGGRQVRTDPAYGHIYDHFTVEYEYPNGARVMSQCRHHDNTDTAVWEMAIGSKGNYSTQRGQVLNVKGGETWSDTRRYSPYVQEHTDLINSIRAGKPLNEGRQVAESTLTAIMGRMSAYTGKRVSWDFALNKSELDTMPKKLEFGPPMEVPPVPMPGKDRLI